MTPFWQSWPSRKTEFLLSGPATVVLAALCLQLVLAFYVGHLVLLNPLGILIVAIIFALFYEIFVDKNPVGKVDDASCRIASCAALVLVYGVVLAIVRAL